MDTDLADRGIAAPDDDLIYARCNQFADDRIASGIVRSNADALGRLPAVGIFRVSGGFSDWVSGSVHIERLFGGHWVPPAVADCGNPLGPAPQPWKAIERRRRSSEILLQEPNRMIGGEIGKASGRALQE